MFSRQIGDDLAKTKVINIKKLVVCLTAMAVAIEVRLSLQSGEVLTICKPHTHFLRGDLLKTKNKTNVNIHA